MKLKEYCSDDFHRGRSRAVEILWIVVQWIFISSWLPGVQHRVVLLRLFDAKLGSGVVLKPRIRIKFPWRLLLVHCFICISNGQCYKRYAIVFVNR